MITKEKMERKICSERVTPRLFSNRLLEKCSRTHPATPLILYLPAVIYWLFRSFRTLPFVQIIIFLIAGILSWTLLEYLLH